MYRWHGWYRVAQLTDDEQTTLPWAGGVTRESAAHFEALVWFSRGPQVLPKRCAIFYRAPVCTDSERRAHHRLAVIASLHSFSAAGTLRSQVATKKTVPTTFSDGTSLPSSAFWQGAAAAGAAGVRWARHTHLRFLRRLNAPQRRLSQRPGAHESRSAAWRSFLFVGPRRGACKPPRLGNERNVHVFVSHSHDSASPVSGRRAHAMRALFWPVLLLMVARNAWGSIFSAVAKRLGPLLLNVELAMKLLRGLDLSSPSLSLLHLKARMLTKYMCIYIYFFSSVLSRCYLSCESRTG